MQQQELQVCIDVLTELLSEARNPRRAEENAAYLRNQFVFFGLSRPEQKEIGKRWMSGLDIMDDRSDRWQLIRMLWELPEREYQYTAIDWLNGWPKKWYAPEDVAELEHLIRTKSWWETVDSIAPNYLAKWQWMFPERARATFGQWRNADSFWLQRACLIYQLKYKEKTDIAYLEDLIAQFHPIKEFFVQKAIGWSLRQLSKHNKEAVIGILERQPVTGLARREASKYL